MSVSASPTGMKTITAATSSAPECARNVAMASRAYAAQAQAEPAAHRPHDDRRGDELGQRAGGVAGDRAAAGDDLMRPSSDSIFMSTLIGIERLPERRAAGEEAQQRPAGEAEGVGAEVEEVGGRGRARRPHRVGARPVARELEAHHVERARPEVGEADVDLVEAVETVEDLRVLGGEVEVELTAAHLDAVAVAPQKPRGRGRRQRDLGGAAALGQPVLDPALAETGHEQLGEDDECREDE